MEDFNRSQTPYDALNEKWAPVLDHAEMGVIDDPYKRKVTAALLENQERALREQHLHEATPANAMGAGGFDVSAAAHNASNNNIAGYDPILISLVRRSMPNLLAYDLAGVQPMSAPTGLIFAMRARYDSQSGNEALYQEAFAKFSGGGNTSGGPDGGVTGSHTSIDPTSSVSLDGFRAMLTATAEGLGDSTSFKEMAFTIERVAVEAKTRALKAEYTTELAQDLKAVHGLDAETELANILSTEILTEINREMVRTIYASATSGAQNKDLTTAGTYDLNTDSDGRWSAERFRGLMFQLEREANVISKKTRRGKGNFVVCSSDVASALAMGGWLNLSPALNTNLDVDDTGNTFVGTLNGKMKVYIDPYSATTDPGGSADVNFACVGYRGTNPYDAGLFYCPYVPLQMVRAVGENTFQPKIGFKTRYGMVANPFAKEEGTTPTLGNADNVYYRLFTISNLHGNTA
tara:strand:- start:1592 stop:2977 length:1386 start_codon:yes stop_codon:yes gene_type:complete